MKSEYKRDINGNYLMLYENEEPDTSSYQMRMLVGNSIPSILKCRVQGVDMFSVYGGFNSHLQVKGSVKVIKPVTWIRKVKGLSEVSNKLKG